MLAVGARLAPVDRASIPGNPIVLERDLLAVALHGQPPQVDGKALDALLVRQDRNRFCASRAYLSMGLTQLLGVVIFLSFRAFLLRRRHIRFTNDSPNQSNEVRQGADKRARPAAGEAARQAKRHEEDYAAHGARSFGQRG